MATPVKKSCILISSFFNGNEIAFYKVVANGRISPAMALPLITLLATLIFTAYTIYRSLRYKLPPGPFRWPIVGNSYQLNPVRFRSFVEFSRTYGPIISIWIGSQLNVVISNSELAKEALKDHDHQLANRHRDKAIARLTKGGADLIWADYGPNYAMLRKLCALELFSPKSLNMLRPIREYEVAAMVESISKDTLYGSEGKSLIMRNYLGPVAFNLITKLVFGRRFVRADGAKDELGLELKAIITDQTRHGATVASVGSIPWRRWILFAKEDEFLKHDARRVRFLQTMVEDHKLAIGEDEDDCARLNFLDAMLRLRGKYDLSEDTIRGVLWDMVNAGLDTTAVSAEWAMAELIRNQRVQRKVQEELDRVVGSDRLMTESDIPKLPYLRCVVKEALRLHPPAPLMLPHKAGADVKIGGYDIPGGTVVLVNVWAIGRNPVEWRDPDEFRPERFSEEDISVKGHDFRLLPFGSGRRVCPAAQLGLNLMTLILGYLLHHFSWSRREGKIDMSEGPGLLAYKLIPLEAEPTHRLPLHLYKCAAHGVL